MTSGESECALSDEWEIIPATSPQLRGIIISTVSENLPFQVKRKALTMPSPRVRMTGIGNDFCSKGRHWHCLYLDICPKFVKIVNNHS